MLLISLYIPDIHNQQIIHMIVPIICSGRLKLSADIDQFLYVSDTSGHWYIPLFDISVTYLMKNSCHIHIENLKKWYKFYHWRFCDVIKGAISIIQASNGQCSLGPCSNFGPTLGSVGRGEIKTERTKKKEKKGSCDGLKERVGRECGRGQGYSQTPTHGGDIDWWTGLAQQLPTTR